MPRKPREKRRFEPSPKDVDDALAASRRKWVPMRPAKFKLSGTHDAIVDGTHVRVWMNDAYTAQVSVEAVQTVDGFPAVFHLSIKRNDRKPIVLWRDVQRIKNDVLGPDREGFQVFPAESRLVDTANQYHIFVFDDAKVRMPVGFGERMVSSVSSHGAVQEPFGENEPPDVISEEEFERRLQEYTNGAKGADDAQLSSD